MPLDASTKSALKQGVRAAAETVFVGSSNLLNGDLKRGSVYAALGMAARMTIGYPGALLVAVASYLDSTTGKTLPEVLDMEQPRVKKAETAPAATASTKSA